MRQTKTCAVLSATILFASSLMAISWDNAAAQNATPSSHPQLKTYDEWVKKNIKPTYRRYWQIRGGGPGRGPFVIYCKEPLFAADALKGRLVRTRANSPALDYFSRLTGRQAQLVPSSQLNEALKAGIIDCLGFGGAPAAKAEAGGSNGFSRESIDASANEIGLQISHRDLLLKSKDVLDWHFYQASSGYLGRIQQIFAGYMHHAVNENSPLHARFAGFWAVRIFEYTKLGQPLPYKSLGRILLGNCAGQEELCKGVQIELKRMGKYSGKIDGVIGKGTLAAIVDISGKRTPVDRATLKSLEAFSSNTDAGAAPPPAPTGTSPSTSAAQPGASTTDNLDDF